MEKEITSGNYFSDPVLGRVAVSVSRRARRISIRVRPDGSVRLTLPVRVSLQEGLRFLESRREWILRARARMAAHVPAPAPDAVTIKAWRDEARALLPRRLAELARLHGFQYGKVSLRDARTRWGSCSAGNDISLSIRLMRLPRHLIDYILLHELCHTRVKNHGPRFHALLDAVTAGRHPTLQRELRAYR